MVRTNFKTFEEGDQVIVRPDYPYLNTSLLEIGKVYTVTKMIEVAGVVTLEGFPYNKTFPDDCFKKIDFSPEEQYNNCMIKEKK